MTPTTQQQGDGVIRRRAPRWLLLSGLTVVLFGCDAGNQLASSTVAAPLPPTPVVAAPSVLAAAKLAAPASASTSTSVVVEVVPAASSANEMQLAPTTTTPPTTVVVKRSVIPATSAATFEPAAASPIALNTAAAAEFAGRTNALRSSLGLAPLSRDAQLDVSAANWARELAASGSLRHSTSPERAVANGWYTAGENVGYGWSVASVHDALVASAGHYANLAGPGYSALGIAVAMGADGRLWVCEVFAG